MLGAIAGDMAGSSVGFGQSRGGKGALFSASSHWSRDTVLTVAVAECLMDGEDYAEAFRRYFRHYPGAGYGVPFHQWASGAGREAYEGDDNAAAARISPVAWAFDALEPALAEAARCASVTHRDPGSVQSAQAVTCAVFLARQGADKAEIRSVLESRFGCGPAPAAGPSGSERSRGTAIAAGIGAFFGATGVEHAIRIAASGATGSDSAACIAGAIAEAFFGGIPADLEAQVRARLDPALLAVTDRFLLQVAGRT